MSRDMEESIIKAIGGEPFYRDEIIEKMDSFESNMDPIEFSDSFQNLLTKEHVKESRSESALSYGDSTGIFSLTKKGFGRLGRIGRKEGWL